MRDLLLKRQQKKTDIDFVCIGSGIVLAKKVALKIGEKAIVKVFKNFGTAMISYNNDTYEFVGAKERIIPPKKQKAYS